ncbi:chemotaxis protein CheW [Rapidithrix thailandica]|uniref:Chemotaxis protein CheW n=1 Tax=Rapidithrix thailandica TaxID=413964 RepID=A0AAW9SBC4_9BACT
MNDITNQVEDTYLSFLVNDELYAVNVGKALEVHERQVITRVPNAPEYLKGIISFRGELVPVIETRLKLGLPERDDSDAFVIIVLELSTDEDRLIIGAIVDRVKDVIIIPRENIKPVPKMKSSFNAQFLQGIAQYNQEFLMLLNVDKVFSEEEISILSDSLDLVKE